MRIQLPGRLLRCSSRRRRVSHKRQLHTVGTSAQIQCLDSRVLLTAVTGGTGTFVDSGQDLGEYDGVSLGDLNGDGCIDAFATNSFMTSDQVKLVLFNDGTGAFAAGDQSQIDDVGFVQDAVLGDVDGDGDLDAFPIGGSDDGRVFINDGFGGFQDSGQSLGEAGRGIALGDLDGDGDLDAYVVGTRVAPLAQALSTSIKSGSMMDQVFLLQVISTTPATIQFNSFRWQTWMGMGTLMH